MQSIEGLAKNFRFMVVQVTKQIENTFKLLESPEPRLIKAIQDSDDYIDTLKSMIEKDCYDFLGRQKVHDERLVDTVRALNVITSNLERIADFSVNIARQMRRFRDLQTLHRFRYQDYFAPLHEGVNLISKALFEHDSAGALRICQIEDQIDRLYGADLERIIAGLRLARDVENLVTVLFILHYLERMGDALLNIGEAIIFTVLGERLKIHQYRTIEGAIESTSQQAPTLENMELASIWGTRSGVRIGTVAPPEETRKVLFKEGNPDKLEAEQQSLERWETVAPGLVPKVVEYQHGGEGAALLLQYLDGVTLQELLLNVEPDKTDRAMHRIQHTLHEVWTNTKDSDPVSASHLAQLRKRLDDVFRVHPELRTPGVRIGDVDVPAFSDLLHRSAYLDDELKAPFRVFIHGDFNLDNVIYNHQADTLHFVDLHRSRDMDYVQDISVFLVSAFRLPVFVPRVRLGLERTSLAFLSFGRQFARENEDATFEARLALGLTRSLITSTRFELNRHFARSMFLRAVYLLQRLHAHAGRDWHEFRVPDSILMY